MEWNKRTERRVYLLLTLVWLLLLTGFIWYIASRGQERKLESDIIQGCGDITRFHTDLYTLNVSLQELRKADTVTDAAIRNITKSSYALQMGLVYSGLNDRAVSQSEAFLGRLVQTASHLEQQASGGAVSGAAAVEALERNLQMDMEELCALLAEAYEKTEEFLAWQKETYGLEGPKQRSLQEKQSDLDIMRELYKSIVDAIPEMAWEG